MLKCCEFQISLILMHNNFSWRQSGADQSAWTLWWFCRLHCGPVVPWCPLHTCRCLVGPQPAVVSCWISETFSYLVMITSITLYHYDKRNSCSLFLKYYSHSLHFAWVVDDAKRIVVTRVCVCVCLSVCVSVCLSAAACPHYCTDSAVTWGSGRGYP